MFSAKDAQTIARAAQRRGSLAHRQNLRRKSGGQSLIVAIIVLFILLFLGGVFIALIANNLRNTRRGVQVSAANKFAEAGIKYLDQQLMTSPEGADWRPVPDSLPTRDPVDYQGPADDPTVDDNNNGIVNGTVGPNDPDYRRLKFYDPATGEGGYTRINFGGPTASQSNLGGRALVRVSYAPYRTQVDPATGTTVFWEDRNGNGIFDRTEQVNPADADRTRRYIKLESVGRVGIVDSLDPTTFQNTEGEGLRRELVAYKALGLTESLRFITDKDKRRTPAALGAPNPVTDRSGAPAGDNTANLLFGGTDAAGNPVGGYDPNGSRLADGTAILVKRPIYSVYQGGIRSNTDLTFYGLHYLSLDPRRGDSVEVAGNIALSNLLPALAAGVQPTKVFVTDAPVTPVAGLGTTTGVGNVVPSTSATFTTLNGLVRDNPRGNETQDLPADGENNNLRAVSRLDPPLMDAATGDGGLTRYRALTRDSAPLAAVHTTPNPVTIGREFAGAYGWGQNLYVPNAVDLPSFAESVSNASSQRSEWLNPSPANGDASNWKTDNLYIPPAVTITLTPRYMALTQSRNAFGRNRQYLRNPTNGGAIAQETVYRYTYEQGGALANPPTLGIDDNDGNAATPPAGVPAAKFAGYPATKAGVDGILNTADDTQYYDGDFIIFAEGNVRIKGTVGGFDPETGQTFVRRLTVVTNGTVYFDGSLLRDNISPELATNNPVRASAKGKSTIAVLAKNYAAVNTTQFLAASLPAATASDDRVAELGVPTVVQLSTDPAGPKRQQQFGLTLGPVTAYDVNGLPFIPNVYNAAAAVDMNQTPSYLTTLNSPTPLSLLARHAPSNSNSTAVNLLINSFLNGALLEPNVFKAWTPIPSFPLVLGDPPATTLYTSNVYNLNPAPGDPNADYLFPTNGFPYTATGGGNANNMPAVGITNNLTLQFDPSSDKAKVDYNLSRFGVVPLDIRIEALIYAQEGSFFIIPGPWFNPNPSDTYAQFVANGNRRPGETGAANSSPSFVDPRFPFYGDPLDIRITMFGAITENLPAEVGDQGAWLQKWGWVPKYYGSTGLAGTPTQGTTIPTFHGSVRRDGTYQSGNGGGGVGANDGIGNGITYIYDSRLSSPYDANGLPLRTNPNFGGVPGTQSEPLPPMPRLPVAPGLLYYGERPIR